MLVIQSLTLPQIAKPLSVFEVELPDFQILPSSQSEITIPSADVSQVLVHILNPAADDIDYSAITASVNGQAAAPIADVVAGIRGKIVKINLQRRPGYHFVTGRNTVEVWAQNRRGRMYYSSFVIKTANDNWNDDFGYDVQLAPGAKNQLPPQLVLLEPERPIEFSSSANSMMVKLSGIATASTAVTRVSVDGKSVPLKAPLKATPKITVRQLTRLKDSDSSVSFETTSKISRNTNRIIVEAEDQSGSRIQVTIPVFTGRPGTVTPLRGQKYALIIGISKYKNKGIPNLEYADVDARSIYEFLQQPAAGGFSRENMLLLSNENATLVRIREALMNFIARASENDLLLIFFAGHGAPDPGAPQNHYIIAHDTRVEGMAESALAMSDLHRYIVQNVKSKRVVLLLDACHSAGFSPPGTRSLANNLANQYLQQLLYQEEGRAIITSSDVNEVSRESLKWGNGHGVFTFYILEGLKGKADTNRDRVVSVGELFRYVRQQVRLDTGGEQNPRMLAGENENLSLAVAR